MPKAPEPITDRTKAELIRRSEEGQRIASKLLGFITEARRRDTSHSHVLNALEFVVQFQFELNCCLKTLARSEAGLEAKFHARNLVMTVHESLLTLRRLLARDFRAQLVRVVGDPSLDLKLKSLHSAVDQLFEHCNSRFGEVRNKLTGHRDLDPDVRLELLEKLDAEEAAIVAISTLEILTSFHQEVVVFTEIMKGSELPS